MEMAGLWSWVIMAGWTIVIGILAWWFYMPNPMAKHDKKPKKKP